MATRCILNARQSSIELGGRNCYVNTPTSLVRSPGPPSWLVSHPAPFFLYPNSSSLSFFQPRTHNDLGKSERPRAGGYQRGELGFKISSCVGLIGQAAAVREYNVEPRMGE